MSSHALTTRSVLLFALGGAALGAIVISLMRGVPAPAPPPSQQPAASVKLAKAAFAGGCFWCMESPFDKLDGVMSVTAGYTGGQQDNPTYETVSSGGTGHAESIEIVYDPAKVSYEKLLDVFWHNIDPTTLNRQFCDVGEQYRSAIFYHDEEQQLAAEASKKALEASRRLPAPVVTEIVPAGPFWPAEEYHQHFYKKNPFRYRFYRVGCGRDSRLEELWGKSEP